MQEQDCDVCKLLRRILQRVEQIEQRLSRLERVAVPDKQYDPTWMDLQTRIGRTYEEYRDNV